MLGERPTHRHIMLTNFGSEIGHYNIALCKRDFFLWKAPRFPASRVSFFCSFCNVFEGRHVKKDVALRTGWPKSKLFISNGCNSESMHFWPYVGKVKMGLRGGSFFWKFVNKQLKNVNKFSKIDKNCHLALPT